MAGRCTLPNCVSVARMQLGSSAETTPAGYVQRVVLAFDTLYCGMQWNMMEAVGCALIQQFERALPQSVAEPAEAAEGVVMHFSRSACVAPVTPATS